MDRSAAALYREIKQAGAGRAEKRGGWHLNVAIVVHLRRPARLCRLRLPRQVCQHCAQHVADRLPVARDLRRSATVQADRRRGGGRGAGGGGWTVLTHCRVLLGSRQDVEYSHTHTMHAGKAGWEDSVSMGV